MSFKDRFKKISRLVLMIWGGISLVGTIILIGYFLYSFTLGNKNSIDKATNSDVRYVLNWCNLGDQRIDKIIHSYQSARSFTGDHLDAYAIRITNVTIDELSKSDSLGIGKWYRGDQLPQILDEALTFAGDWQYEIPWFPKDSTIKTDKFYVYPWSIYCNGIKPSGIELIILKPDEKMIYFISTKM
jgi:hypothetical protein